MDVVGIKFQAGGPNGYQPFDLRAQPDYTTTAKLGVVSHRDERQGPSTQGMTGIDDGTRLVGRNSATYRGSSLVRVNPNQGTTPLGYSVSPEDTITVLDPRHPLCGQTFSLVAMTQHAHLGRCCVVWLRPHEERLIPLQATNLAFDPADIPPAPLSLSAVEQLLRVGHDIHHASQGVSSDASPSRPSGAAAPARRPDYSPSTMAPPLHRTATACPAGAASRRATVGGPSAHLLTP
jgi:hypothetical protein